MGMLPEDYSLFRAARYLGVPPWVLAEQPVYWQIRALYFEAVEAEAQEWLQKRQAKIDAVTS